MFQCVIRLLTGNKHLAHDIARQSGHTNFLFLGSAMNPDEHCKIEKNILDWKIYLYQ